MDYVKGAFTKLEEERVLKKMAGQEAEVIDAMGQESETKAAKWVIEDNKETDKKEQKQLNDAEEKLHDARKKQFSYRRALLDFTLREMRKWSDQLPYGFLWNAKLTDRGIEIWIQSRTKKVYAKGMEICGEGTYDLNGMQRLIGQAVDFCDSLEGITTGHDGLKRTESGIVLPS